MNNPTEEQALAPKERNPPDFDINRYCADVEARKHERVEDFAAWSSVETFGVRTQSQGRLAVFIKVVGGGERRAVKLTSICIIVPSCPADPETMEALVDQVEFRQHIETVFDDAHLEVAVPIVVVGTRKDMRVLLFYTVGNRVAQGVLPSQLQVRIPRIDFKCQNLCGQGKCE